MEKSKVIGVRFKKKHFKILDLVAQRFDGLTRNKAIQIAISNYWIPKLRGKK